jgi:hypothetical protein
MRPLKYISIATILVDYYLKTCESLRQHHPRTFGAIGGKFVSLFPRYVVLHIAIPDIEYVYRQAPRRPFPWDSKPAAEGVKALAAV